MLLTPVFWNLLLGEVDNCKILICLNHVMRGSSCVLLKIIIMEFLLFLNILLLVANFFSDCELLCGFVKLDTLMRLF